MLGSLAAPALRRVSKHGPLRLGPNEAREHSCFWSMEAFQPWWPPRPHGAGGTP